jgi:hypothetical protein
VREWVVQEWAVTVRVRVGLKGRGAECSEQDGPRLWVVRGGGGKPAGEQGDVDWRTTLRDPLPHCGSCPRLRGRAGMLRCGPALPSVWPSDQLANEPAAETPPRGFFTWTWTPLISVVPVSPAPFILSSSRSARPITAVSPSSAPRPSSVPPPSLAPGVLLRPGGVPQRAGAGERHCGGGGGGSRRWDQLARKRHGSQPAAHPGAHHLGRLASGGGGEARIPVRGR